MELVKKNIHMDRIRAKAADQITMDDDVNISDSMPDARTIILDRAEVKVDEVKGAADHVSVRGTLLFSVLYQTEEENSTLFGMDGKLPFEEQVYLEGATAADPVNVSWELEDFSSSLINSRKLNIQALISLQLSVEELYEEETAVEPGLEEEAEVYKKTLDIVQIAVCKKDIYRIREELTIPQNEPNIFRVLWQSVQMAHMEFEPVEEKINIRGEIQIFVLYEGEGEDTPVCTFSASVPVNGLVECHGCLDGMCQDIGCLISHQELEVRPDFDGEARMFGLDMVLDLDIKLYETEKIEILSDVYGVTKEITAVTRPAEYRRFLPVDHTVCRVQEKQKLPSGSARMLQLVHSEGCVHTDSVQITEEGIVIEGSIAVRTLYRTGDDALPCSAVSAEFPFRHVIEGTGAAADDSLHVRACLDQLTVSMADGETLDIKAQIRFQTTLFARVCENVIGQIQEEELDAARMGEMPGIVAYVVKEGDTLWQIGKKYYVPIAKIMELNNLTDEKLEQGAKLLIVK